MIRDIGPFLMFNDQLDEALKFYTAIFGDSAVVNAIKGPDGKVFSATFRLANQEFKAFNGGPYFKFTEGVSFMISCTTQEDVDQLWDALVAGGGAHSRCGWLKDKFGISWQVIPVQLMQLLGDPDPAVATYARNAMMGMSKIVVAELTRKA